MANDYAWQDRAACLGLPPHLFEPDVYRGVNQQEPAPEAAAACARCPVAAECAADGARTNVGGLVRAGVVTRESRSNTSRYVVSPTTATWAQTFGHGTWQRFRSCASGPGGRACAACSDALARHRSPNGSNRGHDVFPSDARTGRLGVAS